MKFEFRYTVQRTYDMSIPICLCPKVLQDTLTLHNIVHAERIQLSEISLDFVSIHSSGMYSIRIS